MKEKVLTIKQMQVLVELGIDISKASMCWNYNDENSYWALVINYTHSTYIEGEIVPTFTLHDILEMLPNSILGSTKQIKTVEFKLTIRGNKVFYMQDNFSQQWLKCTYGSTLLEAAFNMLKWCKQNNYI